MILTGLLVPLVTLGGDPEEPVAIPVIRVLAVMLVVPAGLIAMTGAWTIIVPVIRCPLVEIGCALLFITGTVLTLKAVSVVSGSGGLLI